MVRITHAVAAFAVAAALVAANTAFAVEYNHPAKANKFLLTFVRSLQPCGGGAHTHNPPLAFPACDPASVDTSASFGPKGFGQAVGVVKLNTTKQASDVQLIAKFIDVREGDDGTGAGFSGNLTATASIRTTDHNCDGGANNPCTVIDLPFPVPLPCGTAASPPLPPGKCQSKTSADTIVPAVVAPGARANIGITQLIVTNGGNDVFESGLYLP